MVILVESVVRRLMMADGCMRVDWGMMNVINSSVTR